MEFAAVVETLRKAIVPRRMYAVIPLFAIAMLLSIIGGGGPADGSTLGSGPRVTAPSETRIKVRVLNATDTRGLAMLATRYLRDRGFDVVEAGNHSERLDATVVQDESGRKAWARLVARAFGVSQVEEAADSSHYVDVTVLIGADWDPPATPLNP